MREPSPEPPPAAEASVVVGVDAGAEVRMAYTEAGTAAGAAAHLLLLHGLFDSRHTWTALTPHLVAAGCHVVAPDLVGFGASSRPRLLGLPEAQRYSVDTQVAFVRRFVAALGLDDLVLVGSSLGGGIALRALCTAWPAPAPRVRGLVLEAAAGHAQPLPPGIALLASRAGAWLAHPWALRLARAVGADRAVVGRTFRHVLHDAGRIPAGLVDHAVEVLHRPGTLQAYRQAARHLVPDDVATFPDRYRQIGVPTLIVWGRQDRIVPPLFALLFEAEIPGSDLHVFDECGHAPHLELPVETAVLLRDWLRRRRLL